MQPRSRICGPAALALAGLKAWVPLINDIDATATAHNFTAFFAQLGGLQ